MPIRRCCWPACPRLLSCGDIHPQSPSRRMLTGCAVPPDGGKRALGMGMHARDVCKGDVCNGDVSKGCLQGDACKGMSAGDACKGCGHGGCGHWCVICLWSSARCVSGGHVLIARHAVLPHCNMRPQHTHHHSPRSLSLSLCHRPATV